MSDSRTVPRQEEYVFKKNYRVSIFETEYYDIHRIIMRIQSDSAHFGIASLHVTQRHLGVDRVTAGDAENLKVCVVISFVHLQGARVGSQSSITQKKKKNLFPLTINVLVIYSRFDAIKKLSPSPRCACLLSIQVYICSNHGNRSDAILPLRRVGRPAAWPQR